MNALFYLLNAAAVGMVIFAWYKVTALRRRVRGGLVKKVCNAAGQFVGLFTFGFLVVPLFPVLPEVHRGIMISTVFLCAAAFSVVVINFLGKIAADLGF